MLLCCQGTVLNNLGTDHVDKVLAFGYTAKSLTEEEAKMTISSQSLGLGTKEQAKLDQIMATATDKRLRQLNRLMALSVNEVLTDPDLNSGNVKAKIAARLKANIPEITT